MIIHMHMHVCSILLGKPWTRSRQLTYHYDGEFSFVRKARLILLDSYTLEQYMADLTFNRLTFLPDRGNSEICSAATSGTSKYKEGDDEEMEDVATSKAGMTPIILP